MKVLEGRNGVLFLDNDSNQVIEQITGRYKLASNYAFRFSMLLRTRKCVLESQGIKYYYFIAPNKECVYSDFLPDGIKLSENRFVRELLKELKEYNFDNIVYPLEKLIESRQTAKVYPNEDTHWNSYGAYIGYCELMDLIEKDFKIQRVTREEFSFYKKAVEGDLLNKLNKNAIYDNIVAAFKDNSFTIENNGVTNLGGKIITTNINQDLPRAVIFRDSFFSQMLPFIARMFSRCVILHQPNIDYKLIEKEKPDIVIGQQAERFLVRLPNDIAGMFSEEYEELKRKSSVSDNTINIL